MATRWAENLITQGDRKSEDYTTVSEYRFDLMGKSDTGIAAEFFKLELLLIQTADDAVKCVKVLKTNLVEYDTHNGLHFVNTSKYFLINNIRIAKDAASKLRLVSDQIAKSKFPSEWEIAAARNKMNAASDAMKELKKAARAYDEMNGKSKGITRIIDNMLVGKESKGGEAADTVESVVKSTLRSNFSGFSALKHQISGAEKSLSPSIVERAKYAVVDVVNKLKPDSSPQRVGEKSLSI
ncbi:hypothetical protein PRNP1_007154 [Phytophthora ramorum]